MQCRSRLFNGRFGERVAGRRFARVERLAKIAGQCVHCLSGAAFGSALIVLVALSALSSSCAYRAGAVDREIPGGYRTIAIPVFKNMTSETGIEVPFTNALIRELQRARIGRITEKSQAQVTLEGTIDWVNYNVTNQVGSDSQTTLPNDTVLNTEYRILLQTTLRLRRNSDQKILWEGAVSGETSYLTPKIGQAGLNSANALYNHSARFQNIDKLASDMMAEAHDRLTENF